MPLVALAGPIAGALGASAGTASLIGGAAAVGGSLLGGKKSSAGGAATSAADAQLQAVREANDLQKYMYDTTRGDQLPWREAGAKALGQLQGFLEPGADLNALLEQQPGYRARFDEGVTATDRSAAARGMLNSGGTQKALTRYGQTFASNELNNIFNRYSSLAGIGQTANNAIGQAGQNYANNASNNILAGGDARAGGILGNAAANQYQNNQLMNGAYNLLGQFGGGGSGGGGGGGGGLLGAFGNAFSSGGGFNNASTGYGGAGIDISGLKGLF